LKQLKVSWGAHDYGCAVSWQFTPNIVVTITIKLKVDSLQDFYIVRATFNKFGLFPSMEWFCSNQPDNSMELSPCWEATLQIPSFLWNPYVHCRVHKSPPFVPVLTQMISVPILLSHFFKIYFNIILPSALRSF
jgi:hypothetical protein